MGIGHDDGGEKRPALSWRDGVPVAEAFGDPYYALSDGLAETRHVFLAGNGLPERLTAGFQVAELGFGTGLNALALAAAWQGPGRIAMTSFEAFPMDRDDMARALAAFPMLAGLGAALLDAWPARRIALGAVDLEIVVGDARQTLPAWEGRADAWFLDGFAPARNPELWEVGLLAEVVRHTAPGGTFATYTAAGHVRRALAAAGFTVARVPGYGRKRHMTRGILTGAAETPSGGAGPVRSSL
ncbi:tRNA (5-methylaminomethyl-2-thiouridine)(34)-methyltransferase MnmD [Jannaschia seohaensis]|uniref:tRNA U34 5-methylaminomethyl-2-thiouridine-forming methyltransferase MnmC n=1 Tax=Jannaschia seohaensis TaxID=475081 RepID=A0A2Y9A2L5_9RHOB|nr:tRNA (5-methylaminomethyl-2-thiouridine)(34)-methyltransferase MnmD [Jannaschia seohaensis]PWJ22406.1 tRNA U34 5-methylaminomethyl-2-thiouridine-forming methyltransferase MnmC [Jannaschia seohaensis]SSA38684.1 tRNA U34 5-methylaminomethyl-2-thiouridine-forming methyltransferase MnmC [Jannaschia seohaensis]